MGWGEESKPRPAGGGLVAVALRLATAVDAYLEHPSSNNREALEHARADFDTQAPAPRHWPRP